MIVGFTGTREGLTEPQMEALVDLLEELKPEEVHHGACVGADLEFVSCALCLLAKAHAHPSNLKRLVSREALALSRVVHPRESPLVRNHAIVDASDLLIACPLQAEEILRSGTWSTVRYARKQGKPVKVILPNGTVRG